MTRPQSRDTAAARDATAGQDTSSSQETVARGGVVNRARAAWPAITGTAAAASVTLALLVLVCTFMAVAVPRASLGYRTAVLQRAFNTTSAAQKAVLADNDLSELGELTLSAARLEKARVE